MTMGDVREGGCLYGSLRYRAKGVPKRVTACHCAFCQRRTGGGSSVHVWYDKSDVELNAGEIGHYQHKSDESGRWLGLNFCKKCAPTIMLTIERVPDVYLITGGTLDAPGSVQNEVHTWMRSSPPWMALPLQGECFETSSGAGIKTVAAERENQR